MHRHIPSSLSTFRREASDMHSKESQQRAWLGPARTGLPAQGPEASRWKGSCCGPLAKFKDAGLWMTHAE